MQMHSRPTANSVPDLSSDGNVRVVSLVELAQLLPGELAHPEVALHNIFRIAPA